MFSPCVLENLAMWGCALPHRQTLTPSTQPAFSSPRRAACACTGATLTISSGVPAATISPPPSGRGRWPSGFPSRLLVQNFAHRVAYDARQRYCQAIDFCINFTIQAVEPAVDLAEPAVDVIESL